MEKSALRKEKIGYHVPQTLYFDEAQRRDPPLLTRRQEPNRTRIKQIFLLPPLPLHIAQPFSFPATMFLPLTERHYWKLAAAVVAQSDPKLSEQAILSGDDTLANYMQVSRWR